MNYLNKPIKDLLNDDLTLLSYELDDKESLSLQLINRNMRLCIRMNTVKQTATLCFLDGMDMDRQEWAVVNKKIEY